MKQQELFEIVSEFSEGLLQKAKVNHAGNCLVMSQILQVYLGLFWGVPTRIINTWVRQEKEIVNHYYLKMRNDTIIDATASQFKGMPKIYIGKKPDYYLPIKNSDELIFEQDKEK